MSPVSAQLATRVLKVQRGAAVVMTWVNSGIVYLAYCLLAFLIVALTVQVLFRYVIKEQVPWTEEGARFALVWYAMLAAAVAARSGQQFIFRWATLRLPHMVRLVMRQTISVLTLMFLAILLVQSAAYLDVVAEQTSSGTGLNMRVPYAGLSAGFALLIVVYVFDTFDALCSAITRQTLSPRELEEREVLLRLGVSDPSAGDRKTTVSGEANLPPA